MFGDDYATPDGSCVRDYIHVTDLADAHVAAVDLLGHKPAETVVGTVYNVGRGEGISVKEVIEAVRQVTGLEFDVDIVGRRPGDPAALVASADKITAELGWSARYDLNDMVASAWRAWQAYPPA